MRVELGVVLGEGGEVDDWLVVAGAVSIVVMVESAGFGAVVCMLVCVVCVVVCSDRLMKDGL